VKPIVSEEIAHKIWDVLVEHCGARDDNWERDSFVLSVMKSWTEYRFCGSFGFGGKVWHNAGQFYVNYYREDETPEREAAKDAANLELARIYEEAFA
jgi:hypothetical protein